MSVFFHILEKEDELDDELLDDELDDFPICDSLLSMWWLFLSDFEKCPNRFLHVPQRCREWDPPDFCELVE